MKKNLPEATVLVKVLGFNIKTWGEEMEFILTNKDIEQFKVKMMFSFIFIKTILGTNLQD